MKKKPKSAIDEPRAEYDFRGGERGKYAKGFAEGSNVVVLDPDVLQAFPNSESVNAALRYLIDFARSRPGRAASRRLNEASPHG